MDFLIQTILIYSFTINYHSVTCPTVTCDFEIDKCNWKLDSIWKIYPSGSTPETANSGPIADHTTGNGNYIRLIASLLTESNRFGIMSTNTSLESSTQFSFWYFMHGTQIGTLSLKINDIIIWQKSGRQGIPAWYQATIELSHDNNIKIEFVANRTGIGRSSDIAIDDIVLQGEPIPTNTRTTGTRPTTTPRTRFNASCDFDVEKELCGWKSDTKYGWKVIDQRESGINIGPASDYSSIMRPNDDNKMCKIPYDEKGPQYYCMLNKNNLQCKGNDNKWINCQDGGFVQIRTGEFDQVGERSQFDSPVLDALSDEECIQFQYNIAGTDDDRLNVYVEDYWSGRQTCMWHKNGSSVPNQWITAEAPLQLKKDDKYQIVFEARKGKAGGMGLVSLDHIIISPVQCSGRYPVEECPYEEILTSTTIITTTEETTTSTTYASVTSNNIELNTTEVQRTTGKSIIVETTSSDIEVNTNEFETDIPTVFNTTIIMSTTTNAKTTSTTSKLGVFTTSIKINETHTKPSLSSSLGSTTVSSTSYTLTTKHGIDIGNETSTKNEGLLRKSTVVGMLVGVFSIILIVDMY